MTSKRIYLDYNASAPILPEAKGAMLAALEASANASSVHANGRNARAIVETARGKVAALVGADPNQVIFTSGATEAAQLVLSPMLNRKNRAIELDKIYMSTIEHPCIQNGGRFEAENIARFPVDRHGVVDLAELERLLASLVGKNPFLLALMLANNETGIIQPVKKVSQMVKSAGGYLLVDAVQAAGRVPIDLRQLGADFLVFTSHKLGGPQGAGALILGDAELKPEPLIRGGGQESRLRGGTENIAAIAGFGEAVRIALESLEYIQRLIYIRDRFEGQLVDLCKGKDNRLGPLTVFGRESERLANTTCFAINGLNAETALISLDLDGISVSSGSACSSGKVEPSHVLKAMGVDDQQAKAAIRVSTGWDTRPEDITKFLEAFASCLKRLT